MATSEAGANGIGKQNTEGIFCRGLNQHPGYKIANNEKVISFLAAVYPNFRPKKQKQNKKKNKNKNK